MGNIKSKILPPKDIPEYIGPDYQKDYYMNVFRNEHIIIEAGSLIIMNDRIGILPMTIRVVPHLSHTRRSVFIYVYDTYEVISANRSIHLKGGIGYVYLHKSKYLYSLSLQEEGSIGRHLVHFPIRTNLVTDHHEMMTYIDSVRVYPYRLPTAYIDIDIICISSYLVFDSDGDIVYLIS